MYPGKLALNVSLYNGSIARDKLAVVLWEAGGQTEGYSLFVLFFSRRYVDEYGSDLGAGRVYDQY
jgi:hypothetical protein